MELVQVIGHVTGQCKLYIGSPTRLAAVLAQRGGFKGLRPLPPVPLGIGDLVSTGLAGLVELAGLAGLAGLVKKK